MRVPSEYCPHRPGGGGHEFDARIYGIRSQISIHVRDPQSTLDGIIAYAVFFSLLFLSSFASLPTAGLAELYRDSLLRTGLVTVLALVVILLYAKFCAKKIPRLRDANAKASLLASLFVLVIWAALWILFGELSGTYRLTLEPTRVILVPLALCVGVLDGLVVYAYCTQRFVSGIGRTMGILISSLFGLLLFVAASLDFALYLLPILILLAYVDVSTGSPLGPTVVMALLLAFFFVYSGASPWMLGSRQTGYWLMTAFGMASAFVGWLSLRKVLLEGISYGRSSAI